MSHLRIELIAVAVSAITALLASPAAAQQPACGQNADPQAGIAGCSALIASRKGTASDQSWAHYWRGYHFFKARQFDRAFDDYTTAIKLSPRGNGYPIAQAYNERGLILWQAKGELDRAIADFTEAIRLNPLAAWYMNRGFVYLQQDNLTKAYADFSDAIRLNPKEPMAYAWRGRTYQLAGQFDDAIADEDDAIKLEPKLAAAYAFRGLAYEGKKDRERALADFDRALAISPDVTLAKEGRQRLTGLLGETVRAAQPRPPASAPPVPEALCPGTKVTLDTSAGQSPFVHMRLANREGWFLIDTGAASSSVDAKSFGLSPGSKARLDGSSLPTVTGGEFRVYDKGGSIGPSGPGTQIGTIGTDFLSRRTVEFHYDVEKPYMVISDERCPAQRLADAGLAPIAQQGYYSWNPQARPKMIALANGTRLGVANLPVIFIRIGNVTAPVWVDSGNKSGVNSKQEMVQVNQALLERLQRSGIRTEPIGTWQNIDCAGHRTPVQALQVQDAALSFVDHNGQLLFANGPPRLLVQQPSPSCGGGITEITEPFGTVSALQLLRWGTVIFDGLNERLWVSRKRATVWPQPGYRSMALAWNSKGGFINEAADSFEQAKARALSRCNEQYGDCSLAATVDGFAFACLALARGNERPSSIHYAVGGLLDAARTSALASCAATSGNKCSIVYSECND